MAYELSFDIDLTKTDASSLTLKLRQHDDHALTVTFDFTAAQLRVDRNNADGWSKGTSCSPSRFTGRNGLTWSCSATKALWRYLSMADVLFIQ